MKKSPPEKLSKETQTYPLRGLLSQIVVQKVNDEDACSSSVLSSCKLATSAATESPIFTDVKQVEPFSHAFYKTSSHSGDEMGTLASYSASKLSVESLFKTSQPFSSKLSVPATLAKIAKTVSDASYRTGNIARSENASSLLRKPQERPHTLDDCSQLPEIPEFSKGPVTTTPNTKTPEKCSDLVDHLSSGTPWKTSSIHRLSPNTFVNVPTSINEASTRKIAEQDSTARVAKQHQSDTEVGNALNPQKFTSSESISIFQGSVLRETESSNSIAAAYKNSSATLSSPSSHGFSVNMVESNSFLPTGLEKSVLNLKKKFLSKTNFARKSKSFNSTGLPARKTSSSSNSRIDHKLKIRPEETEASPSILATNPYMESQSIFGYLGRSNAIPESISSESQSTDSEAYVEPQQFFKSDVAPGKSYEKKSFTSGADSHAYLDSQNSFASLPKSTISSTNEGPFGSKPTFEKERVTFVIENESLEDFRSKITEKKASAANRILSVDDASQSHYSARSSLRQYSNPFIASPKLGGRRKYPRSISLDSHIQFPHRRTLRARFAELEREEENYNAKILPWFKCCNCWNKFCSEFSLYDPICNIECCFPYVQIFWMITIILGFLAIWVSLVAVFEDSALPGGDMYQFYTLATTAYFTGWTFALVHIPPSIGMFVAGILFGNLGWINTMSPIAAHARSIIATFVLLRTGLNTDGTLFKTQGGLVAKMSLVAGFSEVLVATLFAVLLLDFTWEWAILFGCSVAPLSPIAIIYSLVTLREDGYGEDKRITSILLMMYALDNVTFVTLFGIFFTITLDINLQDSTAISLLVLQIFGTILGAIGAGLLIGTIITFFPHRYDPYCGVWRTILLICCGLGTILFSRTRQWVGAGYLCTIVMAFTANSGWKFLGTCSYNSPVNIVFSMGWHLLHPVALGLVGAEVNRYRLDLLPTVMGALYIVPTCMMTRFLMTYLMSHNAGFTQKERLFMALLALTKGTPQAVLAAMVLDLANDKQRQAARQLLCICVLEVLITLPLEPLIAAVTGPRLLSRRQSISSMVYLSRPASWEDGSPPPRARYRSVVERMQNDIECLLYTGNDSGDPRYSNIVV